jgi:hypothetical protein
MNLLPQPIAMSHQIHTYSELRKQIHNDLRIQHPEWVEPNGESSMRIMELLDALTRKESDESIAAVHRVLEQDIKLNRHRSYWINQTCAASGQQSLEPHHAPTNQQHFHRRPNGSTSEIRSTPR